MCDASEFAVGAVLGQKYGKNFHPIHFASKTLNPAQQKYTITEKELMVVVFAVNKFRSYLILSKPLFTPITQLLDTYLRNKTQNLALLDGFCSYKNLT